MPNLSRIRREIVDSGIKLISFVLTFQALEWKCPICTTSHAKCDTLSFAHVISTQKQFFLFFVASPGIGIEFSCKYLSRIRRAIADSVIKLIFFFFTFQAFRWKFPICTTSHAKCVRLYTRSFAHGISPKKNNSFFLKSFRKHRY